MTSDRAVSMTLSERFDHAYRVMSAPSFLGMEGLGNEVPYFILPHPPADQPRVSGERQRLVNKLRTSGIAVCGIDLWSLASQLWRGTGVWEQMLAAEASLPKATFGEAVGNVVSPGAHLSPCIASAVAEQEPRPQVVLLSNVGRLFPVVRAHTILNTLQPLLSDIPLVLIFPGSFRQSPTQGSSLVLFDRLTDDDYYRAFDLLGLEVS
ncbi:DUF1788 domain-containing protein [Antrihabitans cavernicola]|uniref:DUF1788 domain-containing protein n=1 Tax=Antrihabitans cavernicola TaxID=2495913 RepID=A0A5A7SBF7_9NOCA|nr:DUF1788 domain-containing protein [Spelaeibacter cavernicola]KAA0021561.1 DUF1788 domain-containing protein [Spelaeibacter cavernicola]